MGLVRVVLIAALALVALPGAAHPLTPVGSGEVLAGTLTFAVDPPSEAQLGALRSLGLEVQGLKHLPLALVRGTAEQIASAVSSGTAFAFYPDQRLVYASTTSNRAMNVDKLHDLGFTGHGMTIAILDSGIDATHPDLRDHVVHNVRFVGADAGNMHGAPALPLTAVDEGPGSNTDLFGHGTLVAGVAAADGTTSPSQFGVAPDAELIGYTEPGNEFGPGMLVSLDHILGHPDWGIDVINASWSFGAWQPYDPGHPLNIATKAVTDAGIAVVFAVGNSGAGDTEMTMNPNSVAPWNISVAGSTMSRGRSDFSSNGLMMDNSQPIAPTDGHVRFVGDRIGLYHPTLAAPAGPTASSCSQPNVFTSTCVPGSTGETSGTSLAAPQVTGLAALLRQVRPGLTVAALKSTLEATASIPTDGAPFWQVGYGVADAEAALAMVQRRNFTSALAKAHAEDEKRVLGNRDWRVNASEHWTWQPHVLGVQESRDLTLQVPAGTDALKIAMSYAGQRVADYTVTVRDAAGFEVGRTVPSAGAGVATVLIDLREISPAFGEWTLEVAGILGSNEDSFKRVTVVAALLGAQVRTAPPGFVIDGALPLAFSPDPARSTGVLSPEGCATELGMPKGILGPPVEADLCHNAQWGWALKTTTDRAEFISSPFGEALAVGGSARIVLHIVDASEDLLGPSGGALEYEIAVVDVDGAVLPVDAGLASPALANGRYEGTFQVPATPVTVGSRLRIRLAWFLGYTSSGARMLFGGPRYGDAGITLTTGHFE